MLYDASLAGKKVSAEKNNQSGSKQFYDESLAGQRVGGGGYNTDYLQETLANASKVLDGLSSVEDAEKGRSAAIKALGALQRYRKVVSAQRDNYTNADELLKEIDNSISVYEKTCNDLSPEGIKKQTILAQYGDVVKSKSNNYSFDDIVSGEISGHEAKNLLGKEKKLGSGIDFDVADRKSTENQKIISSAILAKDKQ